MNAYKVKVKTHAKSVGGKITRTLVDGKFNRIDTSKIAVHSALNSVDGKSIFADGFDFEEVDYMFDYMLENKEPITVSSKDVLGYIEVKVIEV